MISALGAELYEVWDNYPLFDEYGILVSDIIGAVPSIIH
jgi:hypothetical protein